MANRDIYVFVHLLGDWVPAGLLRLEVTQEVTASTFRYGQRYLQRPDAVPVDAYALPLDDFSYRTDDRFTRHLQTRLTRLARLGG